VDDEQIPGRVGREQMLQRMRGFDAEASYYALTLAADRRGHPFWSRQSHWVRFSERNPKWEIRAASLVDPRRMAEMWTTIGQSWVSVHDDVSLSVYLRIGGNALVGKAVAEARLSDVVSPWECVHDGAVEAGGFGFIATEHLPDSAIQRRAPDRKLRMKVLKRDGYRCVVCGRRPADHVDLELHVHHLIPWRMHGPTAEDNLVTLCGTCHKGLDPDFEPTLRELAGLPGSAVILDLDGSEHKDDVNRYRKLMAKISSAATAGVDHPD
jgi:hypothetical protein